MAWRRSRSGSACATCPSTINLRLVAPRVARAVACAGAAQVEMRDGDAVLVWCVPGCGHRCRQNGDTALMAAMRKSDEKHLDVVISLLSAGASCSVPDAVRAPPRVPALWHFSPLWVCTLVHVGALAERRNSPAVRVSQQTTRLSGRPVLTEPGHCGHERCDPGTSASVCDMRGVGFTQPTILAACGSPGRRDVPHVGYWEQLAAHCRPPAPRRRGSL